MTGSVSEKNADGRRVGSTVTTLIRHPDGDLYALKVDQTAIRATGNHLFYVYGQGWIKVRDLGPGMVLEGYSHELVHLTQIVPAVSQPVRVPPTRTLQRNCAPGRNRTCDTRFRKPLLYPLSYEGGSSGLSWRI
jgi:hypothetical protein